MKRDGWIGYGRELLPWTAIAELLQNRIIHTRRAVPIAKILYLYRRIKGVLRVIPIKFVRSRPLVSIEVPDGDSLNNRVAGRFSLESYSISEDIGLIHTISRKKNCTWTPATAICSPQTTNF